MLCDEINTVHDAKCIFDMLCNISCGITQVEIDPGWPVAGIFGDLNLSDDSSQFDFELELPVQIMQIMSQHDSILRICSRFINFVEWPGDGSSALTALSMRAHARVHSIENLKGTPTLAKFVLKRCISACSFR